MKRETLQQYLVFVILAAVAIATRIYFRDLPNFAPVAALAMFAGYYFRSALLALALPITVMVISDRYLGGYHWGMMLTVYAMLAAPVAGRHFIRRWMNANSPLATTLRLLACSLSASIAFFLVTNLATWWIAGIYPASLAGLLECYVQAIPFFRYTLLGDLAFGTALFGGWTLIQHAASWKTQLGSSAA